MMPPWNRPGPWCFLPARCPICGKVDTQALYVAGFGKCVECIEFIKQLRNERGVHCSCLCLFFGNVVGSQLRAYLEGWDNPIAKVVE